MGRSRAATPAGRSRSTSRSKAPAKPRSKAAKASAPVNRVAASKSRKRAPRATPRKKPGAPKPKLLAGLRRSAKGRKASKRRKAPIRWRRRLGIAAVLATGLAAGYLFWLRDSSLVAVDNVDVVGVTSGERERIVSELTRAGVSMTTLNVDEGRIEHAAAPFPTVESVDLDPNFPHGLRIEVTETPPVSLVSTGDLEVPLTADGTLLEGVDVPEGEALPVIEVEQIPAEGRLGGEPLEQALVAGAAPEPLRPLIENVDHDEEMGVVVKLRGEIPVRFGTGARAAEKWAAAAAVLADPKLDALTYIDVRVPERPAAGGAAIAGVPADPPA